ncbi:hypothetical protein ES703_07105 [subsurface metagenome]
MCRKLSYLGCLILLLAFANNASADSNWLGATSSDWFDASNWAPDNPEEAPGLPILIRQAGNFDPVVDRTTTGGQRVDISNNGSLTINNGGNVQSNNWYFQGRDTSGTTGDSLLTINEGGKLTAGVTNDGAEARIGYHQTGMHVIQMNGGEFSVPNTLTLSVDPGSQGHIQLDGGLMTTGGFVIGNEGTVDLNGGTLVVEGDVTAEIDGYVKQGKITSGNGTIAAVRMDYNVTNPGKTTVSSAGVPFAKVSNPRPSKGATDVSRHVVLSWTPGIYAPPINGHKVYISESFNDVNDGIGGVAQDANSYDPGRLDFGTTYYWRVDEVNGPPDYTVYEGKVWSFTTEPVAYAIENITATASSTHNADMSPENTINGSGLDANDLHSTGEMNMWLSSTTGPQPNWIEYEFDKVYKLHEMWVWNSNQSLESVLGLGIKDASIEYSVDGNDYTTLGTTHEFAQAPGADDYPHNTTVDLSGLAAKYVRLTANSNWGGMLPQYGLSEVRFFHIPIHAREPNPDSGATDVDVDVTLGFRAGREAAKHDVYFSTDEQAVADGTAGVTTVTETSYVPLSLDLGKTYYWRVDEVNEAETPATWQGDLWDFTTQEYFAVDDFEAYNDLNPEDPESNRIFNTWIDGFEQPTNGSIVGYDVPPFAEQNIVHSGRQSMPLSYNNTGGAAYSEAERTFAVGQNWTQAGAATFVLYFHGAEGNTGQLYVKVDGSKVVYDGDAGDIAKPQWNQWNIDLASLGAGLQNVTKLGIGIDGNGATGKLYLDDIRLYVSAPEPQAN